MSELERITYEFDMARIEQLEMNEVDNAEENAYIERLANDYEENGYGI